MHFSAFLQPPEKKKKKTGTTRKSYSTEDLDLAILCVRTGRKSLCAAATFYNVPRTTLQSRLLMVQPLGKKSPGPECALGQEVERSLEEILTWCVRIGAPKNSLALRYFIKEYLDAEEIQSPFKENLPSDSWVQNFLKRHPVLKSKTTEHHSPGRAAVTKELVKCWFRNAYLVFKDVNALKTLLDPKRVWNCDETAFFFNMV